MFKLRQIAHDIFVRPLCCTNFFWSRPTFGGSRSWLHNIKCRTTHFAHTIHTTTTRFMSHNHVVPSRTTKFLAVWTHLYTVFLYTYACRIIKCCHYFCRISTRVPVLRRLVYTNTTNGESILETCDSSSTVTSIPQIPTAIAVPAPPQRCKNYSWWPVILPYFTSA